MADVCPHRQGSTSIAAIGKAAPRRPERAPPATQPSRLYAYFIVTPSPQVSSRSIPAAARSRKVACKRAGHRVIAARLEKTSAPGAGKRGHKRPTKGLFRPSIAGRYTEPLRLCEFDESAPYPTSAGRTQESGADVKRSGKRERERENEGGAGTIAALKVWLLQTASQPENTASQT